MKIGFSLVLFLLGPSFLWAQDLMLAKTHRNQDVSGWMMSEKLDGVRGYWNGQQLLSKSGLVFQVPESFVKNFPPFAVEGELWAGRGKFAEVVSIVRQQEAHAGWFKLQFAIFDVVDEGPFGVRIERARRWFSEHKNPQVVLILQVVVRDNIHMEQELARIIALGGEGLMVRDPLALYKAKRSGTILKVKKVHDREARVIGHSPGQGKHQGRLGSLLVEFPENPAIQFKIGTGFSDRQRENPPPIGSLITFSYYGFYKSGIPKFPVFLRVRPELFFLDSQ